MSLPNCKFYIENRSCRFGKHCRYLHPRSQRPPSLSVSTQAHRYNDQEAINQSDFGLSSLSLSNDTHQNEDNQPEKIVDLATSHSKEQETTVTKDDDNKQRPPKRKPCFYFFKYKSCQYGSECRYSHDSSNNGQKETGNQNGRSKRGTNTEHVQSGNVKTASADGKSAKTKKNHGSSRNDAKETVQPNSQNPQKKRICQYFKTGYCNRGERCKFFHPTNFMDNPSLEVGETVETPGSSSIEIKQSKPNRSYRSFQERRAQAPGVKQILTYFDVEEVGISKLRESEINAILKRLPKEKLTQISNDENDFTVVMKFTPSDPDWVSLCIY